MFLRGDLRWKDVYKHTKSKIDVLRAGAHVRTRASRVPRCVWEKVRVRSSGLWQLQLICQRQMLTGLGKTCLAYPLQNMSILILYFSRISKHSQIMIHWLEKQNKNDVFLKKLSKVSDFMLNPHVVIRSFWCYHIGLKHTHFVLTGYNSLENCITTFL